MEKFLKVEYAAAVDVGPIYLEDVQQRSQLGGGLQKLIGQDMVINAGDTIVLVNTGAALMSTEKGTLGYFSNADNFTGDAPLTLTEVEDDSSVTVVRTGIPTGKTDPSTTIGDF